MVSKTNKNQRASIVVIDPHGTTAKQILTLHNIDKKRVVFLSSSIATEFPTKEKYSFCFNPFEVTGVEGAEKERLQNLLVSELAETFNELLNDGTSNANMSINMTMFLRHAIALTVMLPNPSIHTLRRIFQDGQNADLIQFAQQQNDNAELKNFFAHEFSLSEHSLTRKAVRSKLSYFLSDKDLYNILQSPSTVNIGKCIDEGKIILVSLSLGANPFIQSVLSKLITAYIKCYVLRREGLHKKHTPVYMFVEEIQTFVSKSLAVSMQSCRKFGLYICAITQSLKQITSVEIRTALSVNAGLVICGQTNNVDDATAMSKELSVSPDTVQKLMPLEFVVKKKGGQHAPFKVKAPLLLPRYFLTKQEQQDLLAYIVLQSGYYKPVAALPPAPPTNDIPKQQQTNRKPPNKSNTNNDNLTPFFTS